MNKVHSIYVSFKFSTPLPKKVGGRDGFCFRTSLYKCTLFMLADKSNSVNVVLMDLYMQVWKR